MFRYDSKSECFRPENFKVKLSLKFCFRRFSKSLKQMYSVIYWALCYIYEYYLCKTKIVLVQCHLHILSGLASHHCGLGLIPSIDM